MLRRLPLILAVLVGILMSAGTASANQRFLPSGISSVSPMKAKSAVLDYAELNDDYAQLLAKESGARSFNRNDYRQRGYSTAKANTNNTSLTGAGSIAQSSGAVGTKTLVLVNIKTGAKVEVMVRCGNIRAKRGSAPCGCKPVTVRKVNKILINKKFTKTMEHICPSGQKVTVVVRGTVKGWVKGRITAKVIGSAKIYLRQQVDLQVKAQISVKCADMPSPGGPTASNECEQNEARNTQGVCVAQTNTAEQNCKVLGGQFNGDTQLCTIIQINANCSNITIVSGSGNVVSTSQEGNCNSAPPTPTCPDGRPMPTDGCDRAPQVQVLKPAHLFVNGTTYAYAKAYDPDGDVLSVAIESTGAATAGGTYEYPRYYDGLTDSWTDCPSGWKCYRAQLFAGSVAGTARLTATVSAGGKSSVSAFSFPVEPDAGF